MNKRDSLKLEFPPRTQKKNILRSESPPPGRKMHCVSQPVISLQKGGWISSEDESHILQLPSDVSHQLLEQLDTICFEGYCDATEAESMQRAALIYFLCKGTRFGRDVVVIPPEEDMCYVPSKNLWIKRPRKRRTKRIREPANTFVHFINSSKSSNLNPRVDLDIHSNLSSEYKFDIYSEDEGPSAAASSSESPRASNSSNDLMLSAACHTKSEDSIQYTQEQADLELAIMASLSLNDN